MNRMLRLSPSGFSLLLVAVAAALLGTEGLLRLPLLDEMSVTSIVLAEHVLLAFFAIPVLIAHRRALIRLSARNLCALLVIGWGASGGAALMFTKAIESGSPTTASLLQNTQPLFVVILAMVLLKERLSRLYWPCLVVSVFGAYLLSFGTMNPVWALTREELTAAGFALGAAALWASGTVLARLVLTDLSYVALTAARFLIALPFLFVVTYFSGGISASFVGIATSPVRLIAAATIPGLVAVLLFYRGLGGTKACYAVLAEFMYPAAAIIGNWMVLGTTITLMQAFGCLILLAIILLLAWSPSTIRIKRASLPAPASAAADGGQAAVVRAGVAGG
jgi:drug/metabolite transporter, DME family